MAHPLSDHIFMSYSRKDEKIMKRVAEFLRGRGFKLWVDNEIITPGTAIWIQEIQKAISRSKAVIVILSPASKRSKWVLQEITYAQILSKQIFPILVRGEISSAVPIILTLAHFTDIRKNENSKLEELCKTLLDKTKDKGYELTKEREELEKKGREESEKLERAQATRETNRQKDKVDIGKTTKPEITKHSLTQKAQVRVARGRGKGARLVYQYAINHLRAKTCKDFIETLKGRVATNYIFSEKGESASRINVFYEFITTSRPVERWLQEIEDGIHRMKRGKVPTELWMIIGGYGSGKSHIKNFLIRDGLSNIAFLELDIFSLLTSAQNAEPMIDDIFSFALLRTRPYLDALYVSMKNKSPYETRTELHNKIVEELREYAIDGEFINAFCEYGELGEVSLGNFGLLDKLLTQNGHQLYLPLMRLYKKYLGINGTCIFIDQFEDLQNLIPERAERFLESIRAFNDTVASTISDEDLPSFKIMILCALPFWYDMEQGKYRNSHALATRMRLFEIPPLMEDEIIALAEKLYTLYKKAGYLRHEITLDFTNISSYIVRIAGIEEPLTPRFVINQLINVIEHPEEFILSLSSIE